MEALIVCLSLLVLGLLIKAAITFGEIAEIKGWTDKKNEVIILSIFLPLAGYLLACALPDLSRNMPAKPHIQTDSGNKASEDEHLPDL